MSLYIFVENLCRMLEETYDDNSNNNEVIGNTVLSAWYTPSHLISPLFC